MGKLFRTSLLPDRVRPEPTRTVLAAKVRAFGLASMQGPEIADFRRNPAPIPDGRKPIPSTLLKASDEQTVVSVAALLNAASLFEPERLDEWGIVASPRYPGRAQLAVALDRFAAEGVWGVSPHLIPHFALHSPAGTLSLALGIHGPNLGIGGGPDSPIQAVLTALTWLEEGRVPGVWLVLSGYSPEFIPSRGDESPADCDCQALALALVPRRSRMEGAIVRVVQGKAEAREEPLDLVELAGWLKPERLSRPVESPSTYRPHIRIPASVDWNVRVVATDPVGGHRLELGRAVQDDSQ